MNSANFQSISEFSNKRKFVYSFFIEIVWDLENSDYQQLTAGLTQLQVRMTKNNLANSKFLRDHFCLESHSVSNYREFQLGRYSASQSARFATLNIHRYDAHLLTCSSLEPSTLPQSLEPHRPQVTATLKKRRRHSTEQQEP